MSVFVKSVGQSLGPSSSIAAPTDTRITAAGGLAMLCVYFPPLAIPVGAVAAGAVYAAARKHLAG